MWGPGQIVKEALLGAFIPLLSEEILTEVLACSKFNQNKVAILIDYIIDRGIF